jgi:hypothetical protein
MPPFRLFQTQRFFISEKTLIAIVGVPAHLFGFRWQVPIVWITVADQSRFDFSLPKVRPIHG